jgi:hypothetical protein
MLTLRFRHSAVGNGRIGCVPTDAAMKLGGYGADSKSTKKFISSTTGQEHTDSAIEQLKQLFSIHRGFLKPR